MPILLLIFLAINSTWCFQLRCESIIMPRYLIQYSLFSCLLYKRRLKVEPWKRFWGGWKSMKFDFSIFKESLLALSQVWILINSEFILTWTGNLEESTAWREDILCPKRGFWLRFVVALSESQTQCLAGNEMLEISFRW